jgi:hypothetical protein
VSEIVVIPVWGDMTDDAAFAEWRIMGEVVGYRWWWRFTKRLRWVAYEVDA